MNTFDLTLDLDKRFDNAPVRMRQGDKSGTTIRAAIYDHGELLSGNFTVRYVQAIVGHDHRYYRETGVLANGIATVTVDETYAATVAGSTFGYFQILQGSAVIASTQSFAVHVLPDATYQAEVGEKYDSAIEDALAELDEATGRISQMVVDATAEYLEDHPELTTTVEDNSLTDAKLIQKGGILQREQWLETMLPNIPRKATAEADVHSVTDSAGGGPLGISVYGRSTQDGTPTPDAPVPIQSVTPNYIGFSDKVTSSSNGVTWSAGEGGRLKAVGTATGNTYAVGTPTDADLGKSYIPLLPAGTYTATSYGQVEFNVYSMPVGSASGTSLRSYSKDDFTFTLTEPRYVQLGVRVTNGVVTDTEYELSIYEGSVRHPYTPKGSVGLGADSGNILPNDKFNGVVQKTFTSNGVTLTRNDDGSVTLGGTATAVCYFNVGGPFTVYAGETYALSGCPTNSLNLLLYNDYKGLTDQGSGAVKTFTATTYFNIFIRVPNGANVNGLTFYPQLERGGTIHPYRPYVNPVTIPIDLGGRSLRSLPDGTRDEVTVDEWGHAVLTQRVGAVTLDGSTYKATSLSNGAFFFNLPAAGVVYGGAVAAPMLCDRMESASRNGISAATANGVALSGAGTSGFMRVEGQTFSSTSDVNTWLAENPTTVLYPLAEPITIDLGYLDPALLPAPDLTAYAVPSAPSVLRYGYAVAESTSSNLAPAETSPATASHAVGTLLTLDGQLVKVTSAIAVGEAVTIGGNVRTTTIAAELAALA